jgi:parvulin-like peptidyl-prolyl isomerase
LITPTPGAESAEDSAEPINLDVPLPTSVTEDEFDSNKGNYLAEIKQYKVDEAFIMELVRTQLYREKLNADLAKGITPPTEEQVWARHILVETEETALDILQQIEDGGDFGDLARSESTGPTGVNGGDLGWFGRGRMVPEFEEAAFNAEIGEVAGPVETQFGFHLIQVVGHEDRPADPSALDNLIFTALADLLNQAKEEIEINFIVEDWITYTPTNPDIPRAPEAQQPQLQPTPQQ